LFGLEELAAALRQQHLSRPQSQDFIDDL
jgi:hypothetical protein